MKKLFHFLDRLDEYIVIILFMCVCIIVPLSVFGRFTTLFTIRWSEEFSRYVYIWLAYLSVGITAKSDGHFRATIVVDALPKALGNLCKVLAHVITIGYLGVVIYISIDLLKGLMNMGQLSPILHIPVWIAYASIPVGCLSMIIRTLQRLYLEYRAGRTLPEEEVTL